LKWNQSGAYSWDFSLGSAISSIASNGVEAVASALLLGAIKVVVASFSTAAITAVSLALVPV
jgi:hypothetical protein